MFKTAFERLQKASHKMAEVAVQGGGRHRGRPGRRRRRGSRRQGSGQPGAGGKDDVIDAEYTESPKT